MGNTPDLLGTQRQKPASSRFTSAPCSTLRFRLCARHREPKQGCGLFPSWAHTYFITTSPPEELGCLPLSSPVRGVVRHQPEMEKKFKHAFQSPFSNGHHVSYSMAPMGFHFTWCSHSNTQAETIDGVLKISMSFLLNAEDSLFLPDENFFFFSLSLSSLPSDSKRAATRMGQVSLCFTSISRCPLS